MNKKQLAKAIVEKSNYNLSTAIAIDMINCLTETIKDEVTNDRSVQLVGFGTFTKSYRNERKCKNPNTKEYMTVPAHGTVRFSAGKEFRDMVK